MASIKEHSGMVPHKTVLKAEAIEYLHIQPHGVYIDATFGAGGHSRALLDADPTIRVIAFDWDNKSVDQYGPALCEQYGERFQLIWGNFAQLYQLLKKIKVSAVHGILADFGTSQMQIVDRAGFSFKKDTPLDMRMSPAHQPVTAAQVVNTALEEKLVQIFKQLGEERFARQIARAIVEKRAEKSIDTTAQLATLVARVVPAQGYRRIHPATKVFQALRIYVNRELDNITAFLSAAVQIVVPGGHIVCISFHSLEDRIVKEFFKKQETLGVGTVITKKIVVPTEQEIHVNPSARSAKLRAFQKESLQHSPTF